MTQWLKLTPKRAVESKLQALFDGWATRADAPLFGVPDWLDAIRLPPIPRGKERTRHSFGYDFTPDVEFVVGPQRYVFELKYGAKYEPLALAEVLHHAAWIRRYDAERASQVVPVIVSQYNAWLRLAIDEHLRTVVRYVEALVLEDPDETSRFAFDVPLAPWTIQQPPSWLTELDSRAASLHWHRVAENDSWFGLAQEMPTRPTFLEVPYVWIVCGGADRPVLLWEGWAPKRGEQWSEVRSPDGHLDANGRYFLTTTRMGIAATDAPSWLTRIAL
jgi:hypothetical protein